MSSIHGQLAPHASALTKQATGAICRRPAAAPDRHANRAARQIYRVSGPHLSRSRGARLIGARL